MTCIWFLAAALLGGPPAGAQDNQAFLGVFAETSSMKMAGMPAMPKIDLPPGIKLPPQAAAAMAQFGKAQRKLTVRLWSPGVAPEDATASLAVPDGLKLGQKLNLGLYRPKPEEGKADTGGEAGVPGGIPAEMVIKRYWGSSPTVKDGQPEVTEFKGLTDEQKAVMKEQMARARRSSGSYFYNPDWTTGYWPTQDQPGTIDPDAAMQGHYALTTSYTGNVEIDVPDQVNFLAPIELSSPDLTQKVSFDDPIVLRWAAIPNILGYHAQIVGMQGRTTVIMWDSSEVKPDFGFRDDYLQMAEVKDMVSKNRFMGPDTVSVTVPAGIFKDCDFVSLRMVGYGTGTALEKGQPLPRVQTKTSLTVMLGGNMMRGGFGGPRGRQPSE